MKKREKDYFYFKSFKKENIYDRPRLLFNNDEAPQWIEDCNYWELIPAGQKKLDLTFSKREKRTTWNLKKD